jgi:hypothetical protein
MHEEFHEHRTLPCSLRFCTWVLMFEMIFLYVCVLNNHSTRVRRQFCINSYGIVHHGSHFCNKILHFLQKNNEIALYFWLKWYDCVICRACFVLRSHSPLWSREFRHFLSDISVGVHLSEESMLYMEDTWKLKSVLSHEIQRHIITFCGSWKKEAYKPSCPKFNDKNLLSNITFQINRVS